MFSCSPQFSNKWSTFHNWCVGFYIIYGILCLVAYRPYSRYIYFRYTWTNFHDTDKIFEYFAFSCGLCCIVMGILTEFCHQSLNPENTMFSVNKEDLTGNYLIFQILCWTCWTLTELYYTFKKIEWCVIGCIHVMLCLFVLILSTECYFLHLENTIY